MFKQLCGQDAFGHIVLASTMWEEVMQPAGIRRETQLKGNSEVWGHMIANGSKLTRHHNNRDSAVAIIKSVLATSDQAGEVALDIQKQIVDQGRALHDTEAGKAVQLLLAEEREAMQAKFDDMEALRKKEMREMSEQERKLREDMARNADRQERLRKSQVQELMEKYDDLQQQTVLKIADLKHEHAIDKEEAERRWDHKNKLTMQEMRYEQERERKKVQANFQKQMNDIQASADQRMEEARREDRQKREQDRVLYGRQINEVKASSRRIQENADKRVEAMTDSIFADAAARK